MVNVSRSKVGKGKKRHPNEVTGKPAMKKLKQTGPAKAWAMKKQVKLVSKQQNQNRKLGVAGGAPGRIVKSKNKTGKKAKITKKAIKQVLEETQKETGAPKGKGEMRQKKKTAGKVTATDPSRQAKSLGVRNKSSGKPKPAAKHKKRGLKVKDNQNDKARNVVSTTQSEARKENRSEKPAVKVSDEPLSSEGVDLVFQEDKLMTKFNGVWVLRAKVQMLVKMDQDIKRAIAKMCGKARKKEQEVSTDTDKQIKKRVRKSPKIKALKSKLKVQVHNCHRFLMKKLVKKENRIELGKKLEEEKRRPKEQRIRLVKVRKKQIKAKQEASEGEKKAVKRGGKAGQGKEKAVKRRKMLAEAAQKNMSKAKNKQPKKGKNAAKAGKEELTKE